jgi:hypothetical protein
VWRLAYKYAKIREISVLRIPAALDQIDITEGKRCVI